jgi:hypothetical protein
MNKIYFTLNTNIPQTLYAKYKDRKVKVGISIVPKNMEGKILLYEEQIKNAENYLRNLLTKENK